MERLTEHEFRATLDLPSVDAPGTPMTRGVTPLLPHTAIIEPPQEAPPLASPVSVAAGGKPRRPQKPTGKARKTK